MSSKKPTRLRLAHDSKEELIELITGILNQHELVDDDIEGNIKYEPIDSLEDSPYFYTYMKTF